MRGTIQWDQHTILNQSVASQCQPGGSGTKDPDLLLYLRGLSGTHMGWGRSGGGGGSEDNVKTDFGEKSVWLEILLMVLWHVPYRTLSVCLSCIWPKARAQNLTASDADKAPVGRAVRKAPNIRNTTKCCRLFQSGFSSSDAIECSVSCLLQDLRLHSLISTRDAQIMGFWRSF